MSTMIRLNPNELDSTAQQLSARMREMDSVIRGACDALSNVSGSAKGLDGVRDAARSLYRAHTTRMGAGQHVIEHITKTSQNFRHLEQELARDVRGISIAGLSTATFLAQILPVTAQASEGMKMITKVADGGVVKSVTDFVTAQGDKIAILKEGTNIATKAFAHLKDAIKPGLEILTTVTDFVVDTEIFAKGGMAEGIISGVGSVGHSALNAFSTVGKGLKYLNHIADYSKAIYDGVVNGQFVDFKKKTGDLIGGSAFTYFDGAVTHAGILGIGAALTGATVASVPLAIAGVVWIGAKLYSPIVNTIGSGFEKFGDPQTGEMLKQHAKDHDFGKITEDKFKDVANAAIDAVSDPQTAFNRATNFAHEKVQQVTDFVSTIPQKVAPYVKYAEYLYKNMPELPTPGGEFPKNLPGVIVF